MKELRPQTDRERQLEQQLVGTVRRLHSLTVKSMDNQKLEEECQQAIEKLEHSECLVNEKRKEEVLRNAEKAKQEQLELEQLRETEQAIMDEYQEACERLLHRELAKDRIEGRGAAMKSQETSSPEVAKLSVDSRDRISAYTEIKRDHTPFRYYDKQRTLDSEVRSALIRQDKIHDELNNSNKRREKWERDSRQSVEEIETLDREVQQSAERQRRLECLIKEKKSKVEKAHREAYRANRAIQNELDLAEDEEKVIQQELDMSSERTRKFRQEISQVEKRRHWLDEMEAVCEFDGSARKLFQQTSSEDDILKERLQQVLLSEEDLSRRLQQNVKVAKIKVDKTSESLRNLKQNADCDWIGSKQTERILLNDIMLQVSLTEALEMKKCAKEETNFALWKELELCMKLRQLLDNERIFNTPLRQLKYSESGNCSLFFIHYCVRLDQSIN